MRCEYFVDYIMTCFTSLKLNCVSSCNLCMHETLVQLSFVSSEVGVNELDEVASAGKKSLPLSMSTLFFYKTNKNEGDKVGDSIYFVESLMAHTVLITSIFTCSTYISPTIFVGRRTYW